MNRRRFVQALASVALLPSLAWLGVKNSEVPEALMRQEEMRDIREWLYGQGMRMGKPTLAVINLENWILHGTTEPWGRD